MENTHLSKEEILLLQDIVGESICEIYFDGIFLYLFGEGFKLMIGPEPVWTSTSGNGDQEMMRITVGVFKDVHIPNLSSAKKLDLHQDKLGVKDIMILNSNLKFNVIKEQVNLKDNLKYFIEFLEPSNEGVDGDISNVDTGISFILTNNDRMNITTDGDGYKTYLTGKKDSNLPPCVEVNIDERCLSN